MTAASSQQRPLTAFNARTMSARQVASTFVPPPAFRVLVQPNNTVLSGPRGSGKTTLLKMLQPEALEAWGHETAEDVRGAVEYTGVFIATDRTWKEQLLPENAEGHQLQQFGYLADAAFAMHVFRELAVAMHYRVHSQAPQIRRPFARARMNPDAERQLVSKLADLLEISVPSPRIDGVIDALTLRLAELGKYRTQIREGREFAFPGWMSQEPLAMAEAAIDLFNRSVNEADHQWALLFDEMELAPTRITGALIDAMRGQNPRILLKLSLSPVQPQMYLHGDHPGTHGQDFEFVSLTYPTQGEAHRFATDLVTAELGRRYSDPVSVDRLLGGSLFTSREDLDGTPRAISSGERRRNPYATTSPLWKRYRALAETDETFRDWLDRKGVDLEGLEKLSPNERAATLRKIRNLVVVREYYRRDHRRRSRKSLELYTGADSMLVLVDGNPRLLKAMLGHLLPPSLPDADRLPLSQSEQSRAIESVVGRFLALVRSLPAVDVGSGQTLSAIDVLDEIGWSLADGVVRSPFTDNAPMSVIVDSRVSRSVVRALEAAIGAGALIHVPQAPGSDVPRSIVGERFRLSYVLAPRYGLPLRLGPPRHLSSLFLDRRRAAGSRERSRSRGAERPGETTRQRPLFET